MDRYRIGKSLATIFFPTRLCANCGQVSVEDILCQQCRTAYQRLRPCPSCAIFVRQTEPAAYICADCRGSARAFALARAALPYEGQLRENLLAFKYYGRTGLRRALGALLLAAYARYYVGETFDAVTPMPLSAARLAERGYNQAEFLTEILCAEAALPHQPLLLRRSRDTQPLALLSRSERERELRGAFTADKAAAGKRILLVDDIFTTGATAHTAATALHKVGAREVCVLTVAAGRDF